MDRCFKEDRANRVSCLRRVPSRRRSGVLLENDESLIANNERRSTLLSIRRIICFKKIGIEYYSFHRVTFCVDNFYVSILKIRKKRSSEVTEALSDQRRSDVKEIYLSESYKMYIKT